MSFTNLLFTEKGRALLSKALAGTQLNLTKMEMGSGQLGSQSQVTLTALIEPQVELSISGLNKGANYATIKANFSNADISSGFYWREIGIFAQDPDIGEILYCYGNAGALAEYIPNQTSQLIERVISVDVLVGDATSITAVINSSLVYASIIDLDNLKEEFINDLDNLKDELTTAQRAGGTATAILLNGISLADGFTVEFIASANNLGAATTINGISVKEQESTINPVFEDGKAYKVWYDATNSRFCSTNSRFSFGNATIPITGWVANSGDYSYKLNLAITGMLATDSVDILIANDDLDIAQAAEISPNNDSYAGGVILYSKAIPTATMAYTYRRWR